MSDRGLDMLLKKMNRSSADDVLWAVFGKGLKPYSFSVLRTGCMRWH